MKKLLIIFIFIGSILNADNNYELKLYETILPSIFTKIPIKVFVDVNINELLKNSDKFKIVYNCDNAVLLIGKEFPNIQDVCKDIPIFSTNYRSFKNTNNSFGAFYWRKGRPQIRFKQNVINRYNLNLPNNLQRYIK